MGLPSKDRARCLATAGLALSSIALAGTVLLLGWVCLDTYYFQPLRATERASEKTRLQQGWVVHRLERQVLGCSDAEIAVDANGKIWIDCGFRGLLVYDGTAWKEYNPTSLGLNGQLRLILDPHGRVWIGSNRQVAQFDGRVWTRVALPPPAFTPMAVDRRGRVWAAGYRDLVVGGLHEGEVAVAVVDGERATVYTPSNSGLVKSGPGVLIINAMALDNRDRAWIAVEGGGISVFDGTTWRSYVDGVPGLRYVSAFAFDREGRVWAGTRGGGVLSYDGRRWTIHVPDETRSGVTSDMDLRVIALDAHARVWTFPSGERHCETVWKSQRSCFRALRVLDGGLWKILSQENSALEGTPSGLTADHRGRIWIVTSNGHLWVFSPGPDATFR